jgi:L-aspartate oxidase
MAGFMAELYDTRRHLTDFDSSRTANILTDVLVIGSGVAGMRAAIEAAQYALVTVLTKKTFEDSATSHAQGGIAAATGEGDSPQAHFEDTVRVGCGLNDPQAVRLLVEDAAARIEELLQWGMAIDRTDGRLDLGREGGHSQHRIVHAHGDQTGWELTRTLKEKARQLPNIRVFENCFLIDFVTMDGTCVGAVAFHERHGHQIIWAKQTILASGGCGQIWRETTNPPTISGDGLAAAFRAGARLRDVEFMQFHPTTLYVAGAGRALISEAVRGEGAYLVDRAGRRFMLDHHPDGELAPRDLISRVIHQHLTQTRSPCVFLDARHIRGFATRFPHIARLCNDFGIDVEKELIPVRPSAHYLVGGIETSLDGSTSIPGLLCCGEAASTGVHGANRLASNSLLEGLVFGRLAGQTAGQNAAKSSEPTFVRRVHSRNAMSSRTALDLPDVANSLRSLMWRNVGVVRSGDRLAETCEILNFWGHYTLDKTFDDPAGWEVQNKLTVARLIAMAARTRAESVGVHYRTDGPWAKPEDGHHVTIARDSSGAQIEKVPHGPPKG